MNADERCCYVSVNGERCPRERSYGEQCCCRHRCGFNDETTSCKTCSVSGKFLCELHSKFGKCKCGKTISDKVTMCHICAFKNRIKPDNTVKCKVEGCIRRINKDITGNKNREYCDLHRCHYIKIRDYGGCYDEYQCEKMITHPEIGSCDDHVCYCGHVDSTGKKCAIEFLKSDDCKHNYKTTCDKHSCVYKEYKQRCNKPICSLCDDMCEYHYKIHTFDKNDIRK